MHTGEMNATHRSIVIGPRAVGPNERLGERRERDQAGRQARRRRRPTNPARDSLCVPPNSMQAERAILQSPDAPTSRLKVTVATRHTIEYINGIVVEG